MHEERPQQDIAEVVPCADAIAADLAVLGISPGNTIVVHSSFKSLGPVPGGIETLILGLLRAVGPEGTLVVPALSWALRPPDVFDVRTTPTNVGAVSEYFRTREGTTRSLHPTHSLCAVGRRTHELLDDHERDDTPCGPHSPLRRVADTEGSIVMLGCGLRPNTTMHALEECARPPYLFGPSFVFSMRDARGVMHDKEYRTLGFTTHGYVQRYDRVAELDDTSFLRSGTVLNAFTHVMDAPLLKRAVLDAMEKDPVFFVDPGGQPTAETASPSR